MILKSPLFFIGSIPIYGDLVMAPMDGYTDSPFRRITRQMGSAFSYTEFINAIDVVQNNPGVEIKTRFIEAERPIAFQIYDEDPERILQAALILIKKNPDIVDINLGCPARRVISRGAGAALLSNLEKIGKIFKNISSQLNIPITAKMRLSSEEDSGQFIEIAQSIEENGGKLIAIHARTIKHGFQGSANWESVHTIKNSIKIPVIANGGIKCIADINNVKEITGCDAVMIGRAAIGNPWIFSRIDHENITSLEVREVILHHLDLMIDLHGEKYGILRFRKHLKRYLELFSLDMNQKNEILTENELSQLKYSIISSIT